MIEAFFLPVDEDELFAVYHAAGDPGSDVLTVICPPLFSEGMRTQLALRELAIALAEADQHVLRFDWRGTGDSSGALREVRLADWFGDIAAVVGEGREITGADRINFVGVRAAALFLCGALKSMPPADKVVLWDPLPTGGDYVRQLQRIQGRMLKRNRYLTRAARRCAGRELGGQRLTDELRLDFEALDASVYQDVPAQRFSAILTGESPSFGSQPPDTRMIRFNCNWETDSEDIMLPRPVLEELRTCLVEA